MIALLFWLALSIADAEQNYRAGKYEEALAQFQTELAKTDVDPGVVLYNMGNCAYRLGRYPEALLYYRRAQLRLPRDPELRFNLSLSESKLGIQVGNSESFAQTWMALPDSFTPSELLWIVFGLQTVSLLGIVFFSRPSLRFLFVLLLIFALAGAAYLVVTQCFRQSHSGIVLSREVSLRSEPRTDLPAVLTLKAGESVRVEEQSDLWLKIRHEQGRGWTERQGVGMIE